MTILFRLIMLSMFSFAYSDCIDINNQTDCEDSAGCEWHVEDDGTSVCEDADGHEHDHDDACDDCVATCSAYVIANYGYTQEAANTWCQTTPNAQNGCADTCADNHDDDEEHCEDFMTADTCSEHDECEWHVEDDGTAGCEDAEGDDHDDHDHDDEEHCEDFMTADTCSEHDECEWHVEDDGTAGCEDAEGDDHDDEFCTNCSCDECMPWCTTYVMNNYGYNEQDAIAWCETNDGFGGCANNCASDDDHDDDHDDEDHGGHLTFELSGLAVGSTTFTVSIMHQGHADYTSMPILVTVTEETCPVPGDLNGSGVLNVADVVYIVNYILGATELDVACGDMNNDGEINVTDVVSMVNLILADRVYTDVVDALEAKLIITEDSLSLESDGFIQGIQMTLSHNSDFEINLSDTYISEYKTHGNKTTLILVSDKSHSITNIATFNGDIKVESIHVVNQSGDVMVDQVIEISSINVNVVGPNPFNPSTQLSIAMPEAGFLSVNVYNLLGQKVATLVDNYMEANTSGHIVNFNASHLASGVYIVQAVTADNIATQKIMLMK